MSDTFYKFKVLCEEFGFESSGFLPDSIEAEIAKNLIGRTCCAVAVSLFHSHLTRLKDGVVQVKFVEKNYSIEVQKEITSNELLNLLIAATISIGPHHPAGRYFSHRTPYGSWGHLFEDSSIIRIIDDFLKDPMAAMPPKLYDDVQKGLETKVKSINKRLRNYDNEKIRRDRGRKSRAIASLSKLLAKLDPEIQELAVKALRSNRPVTNQQGFCAHSLQLLHNVIGSMLNGNNIENWQNEDVIPEAERLAAIYWVMNQ